jgi:endogenous inhibitor of DNA gyrase (YacG/DUF329 family)
MNKENICPVCEKGFEPNRPHQKFCSTECNNKHWNSYSKRIPVTLKPHQKEVIYKLIEDFKSANLKQKTTIVFKRPEQSQDMAIAGA